MNLRQYLHQWSSIYFARKPRLGNGASRWNWLLLFIDRVGQRCRRSASGSGQVGVGDHGVTELSDECRRVTTIVTTSPPLTNGIVPRCQQSVDTPTMHNYGITPECPQCLVCPLHQVCSLKHVSSHVSSPVSIVKCEEDHK